MRYATKQTFGGRRACVGDRVLIGAPRLYGEPGVALRAGVVQEVSAKKDVPWILDLGRPGSSSSAEYSFVETKTEEDVEALKLNQWTWPLNLPWPG